MLEISSLVKTFGTRRVIDDLSLSVGEGELVCLLGSSGCGKTTTLRAIGGYLSPDSGSIRVEGAEISSLPPEKRPVSTVFQSYALFPHMTVEENVAYGLKVRRGPKSEVRRRTGEMLERVGLSECARARIGEISGGQQQRVALARSLVLSPKVLLLDEPLSNLDANLRVRMREQIKDIQRGFGVTMLFVTHDQQEALTLGDRIAIMRDGRLCQVGRPEDVYDHPADRFCANFLGRVNTLRTDRGAVRFRPEDAAVHDEGRFSGSVTHSVFLGSHRELHIQVGGGEVVVYAGRGRNPAVGDAVSFDIEKTLEWKK
ncbi:MAG: ABC transporter ATP-binding protein [Berryella intestinalis]|uniref:ABC transporter ATP-binding protein n=1 Tax=Berryella intestinalis TaxID=1531429 RepID=UPI002A50AA6B|nr:ABC transporter ATP-binding protein [Berryella intestinalis]MDD7369864.1 ABC transporter ATP-binding protein [Berryella intestinalis]MDY3129562.1 ABC transporter ATP-binding protein [Berryella intestinalis]